MEFVELALTFFTFYQSYYCEWSVFSVTCFLLYSLCGCEFSLQCAQWCYNWTCFAQLYKSLISHDKCTTRFMCIAVNSLSVDMHHTSIDINVHSSILLASILNESSNLKYQYSFRAKMRRMHTTPFVDALFPDALLLWYPEPLMKNICFPTFLTLSKVMEL